RLPKRLDQDEHQIQLIKSEVQALTDHLASITDRLTRALDELPRLRSAVRETRSIAENAQAAVDERSRADQQWKSERISEETRIKVLKDEVGRLRNALGDMTANVARLDKLRDSVDQLNKTHDHQQELERIDSLAAALAEVKRDVGALVDDRAR